MNDMTHGEPWRLILRFSLPLLLGNLLQQMYNIVDSIVVGNFVGSHALAAVGSAFPAMFLINSLFMGIGMGTTIAVSQYFGASDHVRLKQTVDTIYIVLVPTSIVVAIAGLFISRPLLQLMQTPPDILDAAVIYLQIIFIGTPATFGYNLNSGILQGLGDSRSPVIYLAIATVMNIILDLIFVIVFGWGVFGVALATVIAQACSFSFGIWHINRGHGQIRISARNLQFDAHILWQCVRLGLPAGAQHMLFSVGAMVLQGLINSFGSVFVAGYNAAHKIDAIAFLPLLTFSSAMVAYTGQNIGAGKIDRVYKGMRSVLLMALISCAVLVTAVLLFDSFMMRLFTSDPEVIAAGNAYLERVVPFYYLLAVLFIVNGVLRGAGVTIIPLFSTLAAVWLARVPVAYWLAANYGRDNLFYSFAVGWLLSTIVSGGYFLSGRWKNKSIVKQQMEPLENESAAP